MMALVKDAFRLMQGEKARCVNMGNPQEHAAPEIVEPVVEVSSSESGSVNDPFPENDPRRRYRHIFHIGEYLDSESHVGAREKLRKILEWFAGRLSSPEKASATQR